MPQISRQQQAELELQAAYIAAAIKDVWNRYAPGIGLVLPVLLALIIMLLSSGRM